jgi:protein involved in polysaccharide export with SLBB domain
MRKDTTVKSVFLVISLLFVFSVHNFVPAEEITFDQEQDTGTQITAEYKINPLDIIKITIFMEDDLQQRYRVSQTGTISYPFVGAVTVAGLTVAELEQKLTLVLQPDYFVDPQITVYVEEYHSRRIFVLGAVKKPGTYPIPPEKELSVLESISLAGGFTKVAAANKTRVIRMENGREKSLMVKVGDITRAGDKSSDIRLKANDIVIVPESFF